MPGFGQIVVGPPGSGKTTYCAGLLEFFLATGRDAVIFNMDPANEDLPYPATANISDLVNVNEVAEKHALGPNGGLLFAMEYLEEHFNWLEQRLAENKNKYILFDFPGQVELYTHNNCIRNIVRRLEKIGYRLTAVNLVDAHYVADPAKFISVMLMSLTQMIHLELPAINVLSKVDLIEKYGKLPLNLSLEYFTECSDLGYLVSALEKDPILKRHAKLNQALSEVIEDFALVGFHTLDIQNKESVLRLIGAIDKSNGYMYAGLDANKVTYEGIVGKPERDPRWTLEVQERYVKR